MADVNTDLNQNLQADKFSVKSILEIIDIRRLYDPITLEATFSKNYITYFIIGFIFFTTGIIDLIISQNGSSRYKSLIWLSTIFGGFILSVYITKNMDGKVKYTPKSQGSSPAQNITQSVIVIIFLSWTVTIIIASIIGMYWFSAPWISLLMGITILYLSRYYKNTEWTQMYKPSSKQQFIGLISLIIGFISILLYIIIGDQVGNYLGLLVGSIIGLSFLNLGRVYRKDILTDLEIRQMNQRFYLFFHVIAGILVIGILAGTFLTVLIIGWPFIIDLKQMWLILTTNDWQPADGEKYGALAFIYGTFFVGIPALLLSIFWGVTIAIFLSEFTPTKFSRSIQPVFEFIAAIPSVIFGLIAYRYLSPVLADIFNVSNGRGPLNASITLSFMAAPIIISISLDAMQSTPPMLRNSAKVFGATKAEVLGTVVFPHAKLTIFASILLAFGRVLGETMVVLMVLGNSPRIDWDFFSSAYTMTSGIAAELGDAPLFSGEFRVLFVLALLLLLIAFVVIWLSNLITSGNPVIFKLIAMIYFPIHLLFAGIGEIKQLFIKRIEVTDDLLEKRITARTRKSFVTGVLFGAVMFFVIGVVFYFLFQVLQEGFGEISLGFITENPSYSKSLSGEYGILSAIIGSLLLILLAGLIAFPISTMTGIYLSEFAGDTRFNTWVRAAIVNISAIPSIVVGIFVYGAFTIGLNMGQGLLPGAIALGIMMIPIVTTNTIEALRNIPDSHKLSALAIGSTRWEAVAKHRVPYAMPSIITGYVLGIARVIGETAPLLWIAAALNYSKNIFPTSLTHQGIRVLPFEIYYQLLFSPHPRSEYWAIGIAVVLLTIIAILMIIAYTFRILIRRKFEYQGAI